MQLYDVVEGHGSASKNGFERDLPLSRDDRLENEFFVSMRPVTEAPQLSKVAH